MKDMRGEATRVDGQRRMATVDLAVKGRRGERFGQKKT
jgi:hypothetical protein